MRPTGSSTILEYRRCLAVQRIRDGYSVQTVAQFLGVDPSSVRRWIAAFGRDGDAGLKARPVQGRPAKLTTTQEKIVCRWLADNPAQHGFATELWTAPRLAQLIEQEFSVRFHPDNLTVWLRHRGYTPQKPAAPTASATTRPSPRGWPRIGRASKKRAPAGRVSAVDGRKRAADGAAVAAQLGLTWTSAPTEAQGGASREGVGGSRFLPDAAA